MANLVRLSATQIGMFLRCPRQWAFRYKEGLKVPPSGAMKQSGAFHTTAERNYKQKAESLTDLPLDEQTDFFAETWEKELTREEIVFDKEKGETAASLKDQGVMIVKEHMARISPFVTPKSAEAVEEKITLALTTDKGSGTAYELVAVIDVTDTNDVIRDNKALGKTPTQKDIDRDIQLSTYALAKRFQTRQPERGLALDIVVKNKTPKAVMLTTERTREHLQIHLRDTVGHVAKAIAAESFPANPTGWWCDPRWCGYWSRCMGRGLKTVDMGQNLEQQLKESIDNAERTEQ